MKARWEFRSMRNFFGLTDEYQEGMYEQLFLLKYHGSWSIFESYNLPVRLREWFVKRLARQIDEEAKEIKKAQQK
jgi:hypothetical protein